MNRGNIFSKERYTLELIFAEEGLFEISKNKNPSKITRYMVVAAMLFLTNMKQFTKITKKICTNNTRPNV